jgi:hypothetical protein
MNPVLDAHDPDEEHRLQQYHQQYSDLTMALQDKDATINVLKDTNNELV